MEAKTCKKCGCEVKPYGRRKLFRCKSCMDTKFFESDSCKCCGGPKTWSKSGKTLSCRPCQKAHEERWRKENPGLLRNRLREQHWKDYGAVNPDGSPVTVKDYDNLLAYQDNGCAICGVHEDDTKTNLHLDHDHETGLVRGLLCGPCNRAIGLFKDQTDVILKASAYLLAHKVSEE